MLTLRSKVRESRRDNKTSKRDRVKDGVVWDRVRDIC
jgi:hypothetical protein